MPRGGEIKPKSKGARAKAKAKTRPHTKAKSVAKPKKEMKKKESKPEPPLESKESKPEPPLESKPKPEPPLESKPKPEPPLDPMPKPEPPLDPMPSSRRTSKRKRSRPMPPPEPQPMPKSRKKGKKNEETGGEAKRDRSKTKKFNEIWECLDVAVQEQFLGLATRSEKTEFINGSIDRTGGKLVVKKGLMWTQEAKKKDKCKKGEDLHGVVLAEAVGKVGTMENLKQAVRCGAVTRSIVKGLEVLGKEKQEH